MDFPNHICLFLSGHIVILYCNHLYVLSQQTLVRNLQLISLIEFVTTHLLKAEATSAWAITLFNRLLTFWQVDFRQVDKHPIVKEIENGICRYVKSGVPSHI